MFTKLNVFVGFGVFVSGMFFNYRSETAVCYPDVRHVTVGTCRVADGDEFKTVC